MVVSNESGSKQIFGGCCLGVFCMSDGTVKWFNQRKGYGFLCTADGREIFVHYSNISGEGFKNLSEGDPVSFDIVEGEKGPRAENVIPKSAPVA